MNMVTRKQFLISGLLLHMGVFVLAICSYSQRAVQNLQQSETLISSSSYGLYFRGFNGAEVTLDNNGKPILAGKDLEAIPGKLYWNNEYAAAKLYLKNNQLLGEFKVRFEQLNQVFYVLLEKENKTQVVDPVLVERIVFNGAEQGWPQPVFVSNFSELSAKFTNPTHAYLQELVTGPIGVYKSNKSIIRYQDSLFGTIKKPLIVPQQSYYIFYDGDYKELKKLSFKNVVKMFPFLEKEFQRLGLKSSDLEEEKQLLAGIQMINNELNKKGRK
jgi:hypothetical protein